MNHKMKGQIYRLAPSTAALFTILLSLAGCGHEHDAVRAWNQHKTDFELRDIAMAIGMYGSINHHLPISAGTNEQLDAALYRNLMGYMSTNPPMRYLIPSREDAAERYASNGCLVDVWGNPFACRVVQTNSSGATNKVTLLLWSYGPNGKNDNRTRDDVVVPPIEVRED
jgi:hypothetical protein